MMVLTFDHLSQKVRRSAPEEVKLIEENSYEYQKNIVCEKCGSKTNKLIYEHQLLNECCFFSENVPVVLFLTRIKIFDKLSIIVRTRFEHLGLNYYSVFLKQEILSEDEYGASEIKYTWTYKNSCDKKYEANIFLNFFDDPYTLYDAINGPFPIYLDS